MAKENKDPNKNNDILKDLNQNSEMNLIQGSETKEALEGLETPLEGILVKADEIAENTKPKDVQKIQIEAGEDNELAGAFFKMLRGPKGYTPEAGKDFLTEEDLKKIKKDVANSPEAKGDKGDRGKAGVDGIDGFDGETGKKGDPGIDGVDGRDGIDGASVDQEEVITAIVKKLPKVKGKQPVVETATQIKKKLEGLKSGLDYDSLKNKPDLERMVSVARNQGGSKTVSLTELDDIDYSGLTVTDGIYDLATGAIGNLTGEVTSVGLAAVVDVTAISNQTLVTAVATDMILIEDATDGALKRVDASDFLDGAGTVTSVSVVTANGLSGSVATATTTPAITLDVSALDASKIADGSVSDTEFQYINSVTSNVQTQIDGITAGNLPWTEVTGTSQSAAVNNGYIANNAGLVTVTIPTTAAIGEVIRVGGKGAGLWKLAQGASEIIHFGSTDTTTGAGGSITATNRYDSIELICIVANTEWLVLSSVGNLTII